MKFLWFHLMPYKELPDDFKEKHPSVWVDIHSSLFDPKRAHHMYNEFLDELEYAAECGFDAICCNEHHSNGYGLMPSPNLIAAALARRTTDTAICVLGNSLALYNPPTRVAEEFAMIDCISGGRLIAGFPVGTPMDTTYAYGTNPSQLRDRYYEAHDLVLRAWTEQETFAFNGRFNQQRYVNIWPRPIQQPHPPIWIPGARLGRDLALGRRDGLRVLLPLLLRLQDGPERHEGLLGGDGAARQGPQPLPRRLRAVGRRGREPAAGARPLHARPPSTSTAAACTSMPRFASPPGYVTEATQRAGIESQVKMAAEGKAGGGPSTNAASATKMQSLARDMKSIVDNGYVIIGSPDEVVEQLRELATSLNVGQLMLMMQFGNLSSQTTKYNTRLFAEKVMPKLKPLFAEWENRWWPQPLDRRQRATLPAFQPATTVAAE